RCAPDVVCSSSREGGRATLAHRVTRNLRREEVSTMKKGQTSWLFGLALGVVVMLATALAFTVTPVARGDTPTPATYTDAVGDMQGAGAPDITSVTVGDKGGTVTFAVTTTALAPSAEVDDVDVIVWLDPNDDAVPEYAYMYGVDQEGAYLYHWTGDDWA